MKWVFVGLTLLNLLLFTLIQVQEQPTTKANTKTQLHQPIQADKVEIVPVPAESDK